MAIRAGTLYVVGTPLGNLGDISPRAVETLSSVDLVAAEDTRRTGRLLAALGVSAPLISYHQHNEKSRCESLVQKMSTGISIALVSDGGMPVISDPGHALVQAAIAADIPVVPIPGPTAAVSALVISGIDSDRFAFEGFLPRAGIRRQERMRELAAERRTMVIYEAPHRLTRTLVDLNETLGERAAAVARELTKIHEECVRGTLTSLAEHYGEHPPRGECVIVVAGRQQAASGEDEESVTERDVMTMLRVCMQDGLSRSDAVRAVVAKTGWARRRVYQMSLQL